MLCKCFKALLLVWTRTHATPCSGSSHCRSDSRSHLVGNSSLSTLTLDVASVTQFQPLGLSCSISIVTRIIVSDPCRTTHHISPNNPPRTEVTIKVNAPLLQAARAGSPASGRPRYVWTNLAQRPAPNWRLRCDKFRKLLHSASRRTAQQVGRRNRGPECVQLHVGSPFGCGAIPACQTRSTHHLIGRYTCTLRKSPRHDSFHGFCRCSTS
jgi:hypothetical protein